MKRVVCQDSYLIGRRDLKNGYLTLTFGPFQRCNSTKPGHFVHIDLPGSNLYFRRAFSVYSVNVKEKSIEIFLKVIGRGSRYLAQLKKGDRVNMLGPVGTPFKLPRKNQSALMVAGGVGLPPILFMTRWMIKCGRKPENIVFVYGGRSAEDIIERSIIKRLGVRFLPVTEDGSYGEKELVTAPLARSLSSGLLKDPVIYACGPESMLRAVDHLATEFETPGQLAFEAPMPCGFGICLGCVIPLRSGGFARVCREGPILPVGRVSWA